ncbi:MAG: hypothetical protein OEM02_01230 [Desulfobulbaceae bacterium]|nr:hypothetical protein [Desulfobulbaceae bacterium]
MKKSYGEGLACYTSIESCGNFSNVIAEALTEGSTGWLLSSEITSFRVPTMWSDGFDGGSDQDMCLLFMCFSVGGGGILESKWAG